MVRRLDLLRFLGAAMVLERRRLGGMGRRSGRSDGVSLEGPHTLGEILNVVISASSLGSQLLEGHIETEEVVLVEPTGALTVEDVLGKTLRVLGTDELLVVGGADVDEGVDRRGTVGRLKRGVVDGVAVDLADVEVGFYLIDVSRDNTVGYSPDLVWARGVVVIQLFPVGSLDQGGDSARGLWCTAVILTGRVNVWSCWGKSLCEATKSYLACQKRLT